MSKLKMHHHCQKNPKSECPDTWIRLPKHNWPKSWSSVEDPVVPLDRNLYGHPIAGLPWKRQCEKVPKFRIGNAFSFTGIPSMRTPASRDIISASVEVCETEVCLLHIELAGTNLGLPKMHKSPLNVDFDSSRSPAKSES